jgi:ATP-dependent Clp protease ATP-binding subunit ClpA
MRVTEAAQHAVTQAKQEVGRLGHDRVGTEHLLLGLACEGEGVAARVIQDSAPASWSCRRRWPPSTRPGSIRSRSRPTGDRRPGSHQRGRGWVGWSH